MWTKVLNVDYMGRATKDELGDWESVERSHQADQQALEELADWEEAMWDLGNKEISTLRLWGRGEEKERQRSREAT